MQTRSKKTTHRKVYRFFANEYEAAQLDAYIALFPNNSASQTLTALIMSGLIAETEEPEPEVSFNE